MKRIAVVLLALLVLHVPGQSVARNITFATYPSNAPDRLERALTPLVEYLSDRAGDTVRLVVTDDYDELVRRIADGSVDFAWIGTSGYVKGKQLLPSMAYLATYQEWGSDGNGIIPYYRSYIVALKSSGFHDLDDLRRTRFAFTDKGSTSGYAYPMMFFTRNGIEPDSFFRKVFFLKRHDKVAESLVAHSIDVGAMSDGTYFNAVKKFGDIFSILFMSDKIPLDALVASPHTDEGLRDVYRSLLIGIPADSPVFDALNEHLGWPAAGFTILDDAFYNPLREALVLTQ